MLLNNCMPPIGRPQYHAAAQAVSSAIAYDTQLHDAGLRVSMVGETILIEGEVASWEAIERAVLVASAVTSAPVVSRAIPRSATLALVGPKIATAPERACD